MKRRGFLYAAQGLHYSSSSSMNFYLQQRQLLDGVRRPCQWSCDEALSAIGFTCLGVGVSRLRSVIQAQLSAPTV
ncbi:hypothetical protein BJX65DRAFT_263223 [Aspergillus insuetus]